MRYCILKEIGTLTENSGLTGTAAHIPHWWLNAAFACAAPTGRTQIRRVIDAGPKERSCLLPEPAGFGYLVAAGAQPDCLRTLPNEPPSLEAAAEVPWRMTRSEEGRGGKEGRFRWAA